MGENDGVRDTDRDQEGSYYRRLAAVTPAARLRRAVSLSRTVRELALAGLRTRHPGADPWELRARLAAILYGREVAARLFGEIPADIR